MVTRAETQVMRGRLSVLRCAVAGAIALGGLFLLCWLGAAVGRLNASHMYVALFTVAPVGSGSALAVGLCWSLGFGAASGMFVALAYNALGFLER